MDSLNCSKCDKYFNRPDTRKRHEKKCQGNNSTTKSTIIKTQEYNIKCFIENCSKDFYHMISLIDHLKHNHEFDIKTTNLYFTTQRDFELWMTDEMSRTYSYFNKQNFKKSYGQYTYYICQYDDRLHRMQNKTDRVNKKGTVKTGIRCPARILCKYTKGGQEVTYISTHSHELKFENTKFRRNIHIDPDKAHQYLCSCKDRASLCKHTNKIDMLQSRKDPIINSKLPVNLINKPDKSTSTKAEDIKRQVTNIECQWETLREFINNPSVDSILLDHIENTLNSLVVQCRTVTTSSERSSMVPTEIIPPNKILDKQVTQMKKYKNKHKIHDAYNKISDIKRFKNQSIENSNMIFMNLFDYAVINQVILKINNNLIHLTTGDFCTLEESISLHDISRIQKTIPNFNKGCLTDSIIDAFLFRLAGQYDSVLVCNSIFSQRIRIREIINNPWQCDVSNKTKCIIPMNVSGNHWTLLAVNLDDGTTTYYDPLGTIITNQENLVIQNMLRTLHKYIKKMDYKFVDEDYVKQNDEFNCGVYICWYAENFVTNQINNKYFEPTNFRKYMYKTITKHCLTRNYYAEEKCKICQVYKNNEINAVYCESCNQFYHKKCIDSDIDISECV